MSQAEPPPLYHAWCGETNTTAPVGGNGGTSGGIEWIGATEVATGNVRPIGKMITTKDLWAEVVFNIPVETVKPFAGTTANGVLDVPRGTLENLAFTPVEAGAVGPYLIYLDDFEQVAAWAISGNVELRDFDGDVTQVPVTIGLRQGGSVVCPRR